MRPLHLPPNWHHLHYDSVASTMLCCNPEAVEPGEFVLITADEQTAGRGQRGTSWESDKGLNLTFNIGWTPSISLKGGGLDHWPAANEQFLISEISAIAVVRAIEDALSEATSPPPMGGRWRGAIKWPNDIYIVPEKSHFRSNEPSPYGGKMEGDFKICGMLLEHQLSGKRITASIAGIGINVNQHVFRSDAPNPVSLFQLLGHEVEREVVLESFIRHFSDGIALLQEGHYDEIEHTFTTLLYRRTGWHRYRDADGEFLGEFAGIARNGILTLRKQDRSLHDYAFKEVEFVI